MASIEISCTNKLQTLNDHMGITHLGGGGQRWKKEQIVFALNEKSDNYFIVVNNRRSELSLYLQGYGVHVRAHADGLWNNDLLTLENCPDTMPVMQ